MRKYITAFASTFVILITSCVNHDMAVTTLEGASNYFAFGTFYGYCVGDKCVDMYAIKDGKLYKSNSERYPNQQEQYDLQALTLLPNDKYDLVHDLPAKFPAELYAFSTTIIGCPDCADGGGLYIETALNGEKRYWYIDNTLSAPDYLAEFIKEVHERIHAISQ